MNIRKLITGPGPVLLIVLALLISQRFQSIAVTAAQPEALPAVKTNLVASGLTQPTHITNAGDNSGRLFVVEQWGQIRIVKNGQLLNQPFLDIRDRVLSPLTGNGGGEQGLLSVAFPPNFSKVGRFYVYYTTKSGANQISRFRLSSDPDLGDPTTEEQILLVPHPSTATNHNGGQLAFGQDGYLYISTGDGGADSTQAQNMNSLLGKLLRIDVEGVTPKPPTTGPYFAYLNIINSSGNPPPPVYTIPPDNPFVGQAGKRPEIWAFGLRNPWRFSFDSQTGDLFTGDVGQNTWEEIDYQAAANAGGQNYGWPIMEGLHCVNAGCNQAGLTLPIWEYQHINSQCSITGGYVYRGASIPGLQGVYIYVDYCAGEVWGLQRLSTSWLNNLQNDPLLNGTLKTHISSFGEDEQGELYFTRHDEGTLEKFVPGP